MVKYDEETKAKAVEMARSGVSLAEIQRQIGPNPKATMRYCVAAGVDLPKKEKALKEPKVKKEKKAKKVDDE